jgi:hypothetical protein
MSYRFHERAGVRYRPKPVPAVVVPPGGGTPPVTGSTMFGSLMTKPGNAATEWAGGERIAMMELNWRNAETAEGVFDSTYFTNFVNDYNSLHNQGFKVSLRFGLHYTPAWLASIPGIHFTSQTGATSTAIDFVWNATARTKAENFIRHVDAVLPLESFWAIGVTGGGYSEVLYPSNGYWCYGDAPLNGTNLAAGQTRMPAAYRSFRAGAGDTSLSTADKTGFYDWYVGQLVNEAKWQADFATSLGFTGWIEIITPGSGARPSTVAQQIAANFDASNVAARGAAWHMVYDKWPYKSRGLVHCSSVADGSGGDAAPVPADLSQPITSTFWNSKSAFAWMVKIGYDEGMLVSGENPGYFAGDGNSAKYVDSSSNGMPARVQQALLGGRPDRFYWAHSERLTPSPTSVIPYSRYGAVISAVLNGSSPRTPPNYDGTVDVPPVVVPPPVTTSYPADASDSRFAGATNTSEIQGPGTYTLKRITSTGQATIYLAPYTITRSIHLGREGPRVDSSVSNISDCYIEIGGVSPDHGDGCQGYAPGGSGTLNMYRCHIKMLASSGQNCGMFMADDTRVALLLEDVLIEGGENCPNGAAWFPNRPGDMGVRSISFKNVELRGQTRGYCGIDYDLGGTPPVILHWENVIADGVPMARPY